MQELIEFLENHSMEKTGTYKKANQLLEKERGQITQSWKAGKTYGIAAYCEYHGGSENEHPDHDEYFNQTFNPLSTI